jgi:hypothetical protein
MSVPDDNEMLRERLRIMDEMIEHCQQTNSPDGVRFWKRQKELVKKQHQGPMNR